MTVEAQEPRILVAASDEDSRQSVTRALDGCGLVFESLDGERILAALAGRPSLDLAILVEGSSAEHTLALLTHLRAEHAQVAMLLLSARPTIPHATEAIRRGAEDFVPVPFSEALLRKEVDRILDAADLRQGVEQLRSLLADAYGFDRIVGNSPAMRPVLERALAASRSSAPVLLCGETGTGKEVVARAIHANSPRRDYPFVPVNCAALPHDLIESELFGHRRGAFSGAHADHPGLFVSANRGTLLLDEIGDLPLAAQAKLLRVLQDREVRPVGGLQSRAVDVRIMAATNRSVAELRSGALRDDLFFRLSVLVIEVPPLRARHADIPRLVSHFLRQYRSDGAARLSRLDREALELLLEYSFPGNVRELENLVHTLCTTLSPDQATIRASDVRGWLRRRDGHLPPTATAASGPDDLLNLHDLEIRAIRLALDRAHGNKSHAAVLLGISRDTLYRKLKEI